MKSFLTKSLLIVFLANCSLYSEILMNRADFPIKATYLSEGYSSAQTDIQAPSTGENQTWDISNLTNLTPYSQNYIDASTDEYYKNAFSYTPVVYALQSFYINSNDYVGIDENSYFRIGRKITEVTYPISSVTGGANDNLHIDGGYFPFGGKFDYIQFPLKYNSSWTQDFSIPTNFHLTVEGFGLSDAPGQYISYQTQTRTVVGTGKLTMPSKDGGIMTIDALLIKMERTSKDSVFLNGQPAPQVLMSAFGLEQGATSSDETYIFYAPGYGTSVASYDMTNSYITYESLSDATLGIATSNTNNLNIFPNPVKAGSNITISNPENNISIMKIIDQNGKQVLSNEAIGGQGINNLNIPSFIIPGSYLLQSIDKNGNTSSTTKIIIE